MAETGKGEDQEKEKKLAKDERSEYFTLLEKWLQEAYAWQSVAAIFPYYVMSHPVVNSVPGAPLAFTQTVRSSAGQTSSGNGERREDEFRQRRPQEPLGPFQPPGAEGYEYKIPPIWKRFVAEFIDSTMLFLLKLSITFIAIDVFDFININDLNLLQTNLRIDYRMALDMTSGLLMLELIHRVIVCIFEAFWLQKGMNGRIGGATPGKSVMGLRVVRCCRITPVERPDGGDMVLVTPGTDLGLPLSLGRSIVKNLILALLFPICFALFFFRFNRAGYDLVCNSIVVEDPYRNTNNRPHRQ